MKNKILIIVLLTWSINLSAQNKICNINEGVPRAIIAYICEENCLQNFMELFGEPAPILLIVPMLITDQKSKNEGDEMVLSGELQEAVFIFPKTPYGILRFCNRTEYASFLIEKQTKKKTQ